MPLAYLIATILLAAGALLHIWAVISGPKALTLIGANKRIALSRQNGTALAWIVTLLIAALLAFLAWISFAQWRGAQDDFIRAALSLFAIIFTLRGLYVFLMLPKVNWAIPRDRFFVFGSFVVLAIGLALAAGLWWPTQEIS